MKNSFDLNHLSVGYNIDVSVILYTVKSGDAQGFKIRERETTSDV